MGLLSALLSLSNLEWVAWHIGLDTPWLSEWAPVSLRGVEGGGLNCGMQSGKIF